MILPYHIKPNYNYDIHVVQKTLADLNWNSFLYTSILVMPIRANVITLFSTFINVKA